MQVRAISMLVLLRDENVNIFNDNLFTKCMLQHVLPMGNIL